VVKKLCIIILLCLANSFIGCKKFEKQNKNLIFITIDALRADHLGCYGYPRDTTPNIDKLAEKGIIFKYAFSHWPKTTPSMAIVFTGTYGYRNGIMGVARGQYFEERNLTLTEILKENGYQTAAIQTNAVMAQEANFHQGFDSYIETWKLKHLKQTDEFSQSLNPSIAKGVTLLAMDWLKKNHKKGKFFLWLHYIDPHASYMPPFPFNTKFVGDKYYNFDNRLSLSEHWGQHYDYIAKRHWSRTGGNNVIDYYISQYDGEIAYCDFCLERLFNLLEKLGLFDNTIIIISADHGESLGEHGYYFEHEGIHNNCFRVPLIWLIPPHKTKKKIVEYPVGLINIMPTILELLNIKITKDIQGKSLLPVINREKDYISKYVILSSFRNFSILDDKWKLTLLKTPFYIRIMGGKRQLLLQYLKDPEERINLYSQETAKLEAQKRLEKALSDWHTEAIYEIRKNLAEKRGVKYDKKTLQWLKSLGYIQ